MMNILRHTHPFPAPTTPVITLLLIVSAVACAGVPAAVAGDGETAHQGLDCRRCHLQQGTEDAADLLAASRCRSCHPDQFAGRDQALGFHTDANGRGCLSCHSFHAPGTIDTGLGEIALASLGDLDLAHCQSCHQAGSDLAALSDAHQAAARLYHEQAGSLRELSPSQACLNCHSNSAATAWQGAADGRVLAFSEHATHPFGVDVVPGRGDFAHRIRRELDPRVQLFDQRIECQTCHTLTATSKDLLAAFERPKDLCLGCHQFRDGTLENRDGMLATMVSR